MKSPKEILRLKEFYYKKLISDTIDDIEKYLEIYYNGSSLDITLNRINSPAEFHQIKDDLFKEIKSYGWNPETTLSNLSKPKPVITMASL